MDSQYESPLIKEFFAMYLTSELKCLSERLIEFAIIELKSKYSLSYIPIESIKKSIGYSFIKMNPKAKQPQLKITMIDLSMSSQIAIRPLIMKEKVCIMEEMIGKKCNMKQKQIKRCISRRYL
jgi:hypothetical protein